MVHWWYRLLTLHDQRVTLCRRLSETLHSCMSAQQAGASSREYLGLESSWGLAKIPGNPVLDIGHEAHTSDSAEAH